MSAYFMGGGMGTKIRLTVDGESEASQSTESTRQMTVRQVIRIWTVRTTTRSIAIHGTVCILVVRHMCPLFVLSAIFASTLTVRHMYPPYVLANWTVRQVTYSLNCPPYV
ncbi:hypothetical protein GOBAR_DD09496 [Gossypium barbadense]|nr:hypothetical protein GOBAR_DD09496 [Gossypium barbadense]